MIEKLRPRRPSTIQIIGSSSDNVLVKGYWPERNPAPLFQLVNDSWMDAETLLEAHTLIGKIIGELRDEGLL